MPIDTSSLGKYAGANAGRGRMTLPKSSRAIVPKSAMPKPKANAAQPKGGLPIEARRRDVVERPAFNKMAPTLVSTERMPAADTVEGEYIPASKPVTVAKERPFNTIEGSLPSIVVSGAMEEKQQPMEGEYIPRQRPIVESPERKGNVYEGSLPSTSREFEPPPIFTTGPQQEQQSSIAGILGGPGLKGRRGKAQQNPLLQILRLVTGIHKATLGILSFLTKKATALARLMGRKNKNALGNANISQEDDEDQKKKDSPWFAKLISFAVKALLLGINPVMKFFHDTWKKLTDVWDGIATKIKGVAEKMMDFISMIVKKIYGIVTDPLHAAASGASALSSIPTSLGKSLGQTLYNTVQNRKEKATEKQEMYNYLHDKYKMPKEKIIGILEGLQSESGFRMGVESQWTDKKGKLFTTHGGFQWKNDGPNSRARKMMAKLGPNWKQDWKGQIDYALSEQEGQDYLRGNYRSSGEAIAAWTNKFEKPDNNGAHAAERAGHAGNWAWMDYKPAAPTATRDIQNAAVQASRPAAPPVIVNNNVGGQHGSQPLPSHDNKHPLSFVPNVTSTSSRWEKMLSPNTTAIA